MAYNRGCGLISLLKIAKIEKFNQERKIRLKQRLPQSIALHSMSQALQLGVNGKCFFWQSST